MAVSRERIYHKRDRLRQLRAFCFAAKFESITRSAEQLGITQPAVSLHIRELEHELEAMLFERLGSRVALTPAGKYLHGLAAPLVDGVDRLPDSLAEMLGSSVSGEIHVAAGPSAVAFVLPPYMRRFREEHLGIRVRVTRSLVEQGLALLSSREVDFLVGAMESVTDPFTYHPVFSYDLVLITPTDHPLAGRSSVEVGEAVRYPSVLPPTGAYSRQFGESIAHRFSTEANIAVETSGWGVIKQFVADGLGISLVPSLCLTEKDRVRVISIEQPAQRRSYGIFTCRNTSVSPQALRFIRMMAPDFPDTSGATSAG